MGIIEGNRLRNSSCDGGWLKVSNPPLKVCLKSFRAGAWYKQTIVENPEHALQFREVWSSHGNDQGSVKEFTIELLHILKCVHQLVKPLLYCLEVLLFLGHCQQNLVHFNVPVKTDVGWRASELPVF